MNLKQISKYLRVHWSSFRRNLYGEWKELPREEIIKESFKNNRIYRHKEYKFDLKKVLEYFEKKYNRIKKI